MMHAQDTFAGLYRLLLADSSQLSRRVYNMGAFDFTPMELATLIQAKIPHFKVEYKPDKRQAIADSWPSSLDDTNARKDWHWQPTWTLESLLDEMIRAKVSQPSSSYATG